MNWIQNYVTRVAEFFIKNGLGRWDNSFEYDIDAVIIHQGATYISLQNNNSNRNPETAIDWWKEQAKKEYVDTAIANLHPIGSVVLRMDAVNPSTLYGGTWQIMTAQNGICLEFANGEAQPGTIIGGNNKLVPLPQHSHAMPHTHARGTMNITGSFTSKRDHGGTNIVANPLGAFDVGPDGTVQNSIQGSDTQFPSRQIDFVGANTWSGVTAQPSIGSTSNSGQADVTISVVGATIRVNVWRRTA